MKKKVCVIEMGGTISTRINNPTSEFYSAPNVQIFEFLSEVEFKNTEISYTNLALKISHEITIEEIQNLALIINDISQSEIDGVVISIGTNAIEDIAYLIGLLVNTKKPIIFTGSHYPQGSLCFDGKLNLFNSIVLATSDEAKELGVLITFNGFVVSARDACKTLPGFLDNFDFLQRGRVGEIIGRCFKLQTVPLYRHTFNSEFNSLKNTIYKKVCIIYAHLGMDPFVVVSIINSGIQGIVSAGFGKGYQSKQITELLHNATLQGITVVRCPRISACYINSDVNYDRKYGFVTSGRLSPQKSSILLSIALTQIEEKNELIRVFEEY